ncbi:MULTISPECIES: sensor histidine kinase [unclassified Fusibacter]|uniref:sensor histidine kinase n=1 Tax=unclassified Fusibacter TaxID=2624464 RepID=UPI0010104BC2|nr:MULTISPECIES: sensor histidine kinase [unclassified Fusibacter]MCK8058065.1 sensor histidine kinase [Fusibacter sp. A2]NPE20647.1 hypothetical protein [Fusibacter sp. A1]RXV62853.1 hypothetical protein DWB64_02350 [Fusibacter sp. A1]
MKNKKLSTGLYIKFILSVILPVTILSFVAISYALDYLTDLTLARNAQILDMLVSRIDNTFYTPINELSNLRNHMLRVGYDQREEAIDLMAVNAKTDEYFSLYAVTDADGLVVAVYPENDRMTGIDYSGKSNVKRIMDGEYIAWSSPSTDAQTGANVIELSIPLNEGYVLTGVVDLRVIQVLVEDITYKGEVIVGVTDDTGKYIAHTDYSMVMNEMTDPLILSAEEEDVQTVMLNGEKFVPLKKSIGREGWQVVAYQNKNAIHTELIQLVFWMGVIAVLSIVFVSVIASKSINHIMVNVNVLKNYVKRVGSGDYQSETLTSPFEEFQTMIASFENMVLEVKKREKDILDKQNQITTMNEELEVRVEDRTNKLIKANLYLEKTLEDLKETQSHLIESEKMASLGNLVAGIAHEINTPIGVGLTAASYLQKETEEVNIAFARGELTKGLFEEYLGTCEESVRIIMANVERASNLVKSFKMVAVDQSSGDERIFNLKEYIEDTIKSLKPKLKKKDVDIELDIDNDINMITNPGDISQLTTNFIVNALTHAFGERKGVLKISGKLTTHGIQLVFKDDGVGMPSHVKEFVFEPFFTTKRGQGGSGLGLNIVYNIITQKFRGTIRCESEVNVGTTFIIDLPLSDKVLVRSQNARHIGES